MLGYRFTHYNKPDQTPFDRLFKIFKQLLPYTNGDFNEAIAWLTELDKEYKLTEPDYGIGDFIQDLKDKGYIRDDKPGGGGIVITAKTEQAIRQQALEKIFGKLKKGKSGNHSTKYTGLGDEVSSDSRPFQFGDTLDQIAMLESMKNAQINNGIGEFSITENDLEVREKEHKTQTSTVLMIDISHSMILYGEDRITPAKNVAMALAELIKRKYPKDTLDIIVFGDDAWEIKVKDLPYLQVGPYHTNTVAGIELAMDLLHRRKNANKQIFMITDGKPTCIIEHGEYYKNSFGLDRKILNKCLTLAQSCRRLRIPITTFMLAEDPWLQEFVHDFTEANNGKAFYTSLQGLGEFIFEDFERNKKRSFK
ncbi:MAG TPA: VWA domain-containing protein [Bacteroidia bacterium]|jgi:Ca-activated chloride channel family protein|nr:VWA domain-containing protein [Bacteroidia bacterium]